jgi:hypothetical protein
MDQQLWFEQLMGFEEVNPLQVQQNIVVEGQRLLSKVNGQSYQFGRLEIPALAHLRDQSEQKGDGKLKVSEAIGDVRNFHLDAAHQGALFQAASQFNLLEMVNPDIPPELGVGRYAYDRTQGPACAIACGAGTIYRNYFVPLGQQIGQTSQKQVDCLDEVGKFFKNATSQLWRMQNGYALANENGLQQITRTIKGLREKEYEVLKGRLKVGIQWDTEVTISPDRQRVHQIYCSALPVGYSKIDQQSWEAFATLILDATYEATLHTALINKQQTGNNQVFLTLVGGGVFGNHPSWLVHAILKNLMLFKEEELAVTFISYGQSSPVVQEILKRYSSYHF